MLVVEGHDPWLCSVFAFSRLATMVATRSGEFAALDFEELELFDSESQEVKQWARGQHFSSLHSSRRHELVEALACKRAELRALYHQFHQKRISFIQIATRLAPIHRIPDEILSRIFEDETFDISFIAAQGDLLTLRLTCRRWNKVALDTPRIWTQITTHGIHDLECPIWKPKLLTTWLRRSKSVPIDISCGSDIFNEAKGQAYTMKCIGALLPLVTRYHRWRSLHLDAAYISFFSWFQSEGYKIFEDKSGTLCGQPIADSVAPPINSKSLENIALEGHHAFSALPDKFQASNLHTVHLSTYFLSVEKYSRFVASTPNVTKLTLEDIVWSQFEARVVPVGIGHSKLQHLEYIETGKEVRLEDEEDDNTDYIFVLRALLEASATLMSVHLTLSYSTHGAICDINKKN